MFISDYRVRLRALIVLGCGLVLTVAGITLVKTAYNLLTIDELSAVISSANVHYELGYSTLEEWRDQYTKKNLLRFALSLVGLAVSSYGLLRMINMGGLRHR